MVPHGSDRRIQINGRTTPGSTAPPAISFRRATPADKDAALAISARFPNDWLAYGIGFMTEAGRFFVAEENCPGQTAVAETTSSVSTARIIAVCGYEDLDETAWLQAMRVHPDYHNRGVATAFTLFLMDQCRQAGFRRVRLDTAFDNHPVHHMMAKLGFRPRGDVSLCWFPCTGPLLAAPADTSSIRAATPCDTSVVRDAIPSDAEAIWSLLERRAAEGKLHPFGLVSEPGRIFEIGDLDRNRMAEWVAQGDVLVAEGGGQPGSRSKSVADRTGQAGQMGHAGPIAGVAVWRRFVEPAAEGSPEEDSAKEGAVGDGSADEGYEHTDIVCLEGEPPVQAALLAAVIEADSRTNPTKFLNIGLPMTQWQTLLPLLNPAQAPKAEDVFQARVYEKGI